MVVALYIIINVPRLHDRENHKVVDCFTFTDWDPTDGDESLHRDSSELQT